MKKRRAIEEIFDREISLRLDDLRHVTPGNFAPCYQAGAVLSLLQRLVPALKECGALSESYTPPGRECLNEPKDIDYIKLTLDCGAKIHLLKKCIIAVSGKTNYVTWSDDANAAVYINGDVIHVKETRKEIMAQLATKPFGNG